MSTDSQALPDREASVEDGVRLLEAVIARHAHTGMGASTAVPGLAIARITSAGSPTSYLYEPSLCVIARGSKRVDVGEAAYRYDDRTFLLTAVGLPTVTQIERASEEAPYVSMQLLLDIEMARQLIADIAIHRHASAPFVGGMVTARLTPSLLDPVLRLVSLLDRPEDIPILASGIHREILYRLLTGAEGVRLREIARLDTPGSRLAKAIAWLRANFKLRLSIDELARQSGMARSTLHHQFRAITNMSPLQYQKQLRLHEARRLMLTERMDAGVAAQQVGYESETQFNREYRRLFGAPPKRDVRSLQAPDPRNTRQPGAGGAVAEAH